MKNYQLTQTGASLAHLAQLLLKATDTDLELMSKGDAAELKRLKELKAGLIPVVYGE